MSKGGDQEVVQTTAPWPGQVPYLTGNKKTPGLFPLAAEWLKSGGPQFFPGSTVAPFSPAQIAAQQGIVSRATQGSPVEAAAQNYITSTLNGGPGNPALDAVFGDIQNRVTGAVGSTFEGSGRTGSPLHAVNLAQEITRAYSPFAFDAYSQNANRQMQAAALAPTIAGFDWQNLGHLLNVGQMQQGQAQAELQDAVNRWNFEQNAPLQNLQAYQGLISGNYGSQISQPSYSNPAAGIIGGLASGAGLASSLGLIGPGIATSPWAFPLIGSMGVLGLLG